MLSEQQKIYTLCLCMKICDSLHYLMNNICILLGCQSYRLIVGIPIGNNCGPLAAVFVLFLFVCLFVCFGFNEKERERLHKSEHDQEILQSYTPDHTGFLYNSPTVDQASDPNLKL